MIESKVWAATRGAGAGVVVAQFALWALDAAFWNGSGAPDVPAPVDALVTLVVAAAAAFVAGYYAKHTPRPDLAGTDPPGEAGSHVAA